MAKMEFSFWYAKTMSVIGLVMGAALLADNSNNMPVLVVNLDPLIYAIVAMGLGLAIIIWFMHQVRISTFP